MKTIFFFDESTFAQAGTTILIEKPNFLPKNFTASLMLGETLRNFGSSYFACKYGEGRSTLQKTQNPDINSGYNDL